MSAHRDVAELLRRIKQPALDYRTFAAPADDGDDGGRGPIGAEGAGHGLRPATDVKRAAVRLADLFARMGR